MEEALRKFNLGAQIGGEKLYAHPQHGLSLVQPTALRKGGYRVTSKENMAADTKHLLPGHMTEMGRRLGMYWGRCQLARPEIIGLEMFLMLSTGFIRM
ncbi:2'-5'-Oligoadenylate Synthase 3 [Manis pentadactyla]|nr:2'-5'-Oligoadenylate Synthase 3 [Manis pentadactyla]